MLLVSANKRSTAAFSTPGTVNCCRPQLRKRERKNGTGQPAPSPKRAAEHWLITGHSGVQGGAKGGSDVQRRDCAVLEPVSLRGASAFECTCAGRASNREC